MNKKFLVIGNPIEHSLSPKLHNYWIKKNNIKALYEKKLLKEEEIEKLILEIKEEKIHGVNITIPFKKKVIPFLDLLTDEASKSQSVNTIYKIKDKIIGDNTDIEGFKIALEKTNQIINFTKSVYYWCWGSGALYYYCSKKIKNKENFHNEQN